MTLLLISLSVSIGGEMPNGKALTELQKQIDDLKSQSLIQILREQMDTVQNDVLKLSEFADIIVDV